MIPKDFITEWRYRAPWVSDRQVEQDLVISRAVVELFSRPTIANAFAFRGGTALYKLHFQPAARYSEDIDLVQTAPGEIGPALDAIHEALDGWLGKPQWKHSEGRVTLNYRFDSEDLPAVRLRLKVEINSREHFTVYGLKDHRFDVSSRWFAGGADVRTYELDEMLGTTGANIHDKWIVGATLDAALIYGSRGPRRPEHICLDKGYDYDDCEQEARERGVKPHIRRRGEPPLVGCVRGKPRRWVVERTNSWHNNFRGLRIRWERKAEHYGALVHLACAIITVQAATRELHRS